MIKEKAHAKINLFLNVVKKRFDGYHDLEMVMAPLVLHDLLTFEKNDSGKITVTSNVDITKSIKDNIVYKIALFLKDNFQIKDGVNIHIVKNIPLSAGLAGGSADGAATFRGLNRLWKLKLSLDDMAKLAIDFGADIPFCIYSKLSIARGKGEELIFINKKLKTKILVVTPNIKISTKEVFNNVKEEDIKHVKIANMSSAIQHGNYDLMIRELHNSLEKITFEMEPEIKNIKHQMIDLGLDGALMSGSGSSVFGISKNKQKLNYVYEKMKDDYFKIITKIK